MCRLLLSFVGLACSGCILLTQPPPAGDDFESPLPGLSPELANLFAEGDENFERTFTPSEGLGPIFVEAGCGRCHIADGRGPRSKAVIRFSVDSDLIPLAGGDQLQPHSIPGAPPEVLPELVDVSTRTPPPVFGVGLIEGIPVAQLESLEDEFDSDGDGISGRINWVIAPEYVPAGEVGGGPGLQAGRFGLKSNRASLVDIVSHAYHQDMGVTNDFLPIEDPNEQAGGTAVGDTVADPELPSEELFETLFYVRLLAPPNRGPITDEVAQGDQLFGTIGCATCHVPTLSTGPNEIPQLSEQQVHLYSDLLLHDMGGALADNRIDESANGREWRTKPLWGTRLVADFLDGNPVYLHDGRTSSLREAIELHGGEAALVREAFDALPAADQDAIIAFLESL